MPKTSEVSKPEQDPFMDVALPEGGKDIVGDVDGYWDEDKSAIRFTPLSAKMFDNNNDETRASVLILGKLTAPTMLYTTDEDKERTYSVMPAGSAVGVWYKPGMRQIVKRCGVDCYLKLTGEKKTEKPNPMKVFQLVAGDETHIIPVTEDFRDKSLNFNTPFDPKGKPKSDTNGNSDDDDVDFN